MRYIEIKIIGRDINSTPTQTVMKYQMPNTIFEFELKIIVNLHSEEKTN